MAEQGEGGGGQDNGASNTGTIQVGEKSYTAEDVASLVSGAEKATQALQKAAPVLNLAEKFGTDVEGLVRHVEGSTVAINKLIDAGLIDEEGNIVDRAAPKGQDDFLSKLLGGEQDRDDAGSGMNKADSAIAKTLAQIQGQMGETTKVLEGLTKENAALKRQMLGDRIKKEYPDLGDDDISRAMGKARAEGIPLGKALEAINESGKAQKEKLAEEIQAKLIKDLGLDEGQIEKLKASKEFKELGPEGGSSVLIGKRKISFRGGEGKVTPRELMLEHMSRLG